MSSRSSTARRPAEADDDTPVLAGAGRLGGPSPKLPQAAFEEVTVGRTTWRNLPPAFVYHCRRPLPEVPV